VSLPGTRPADPRTFWLTGGNGLAWHRRAAG